MRIDAATPAVTGEDAAAPSTRWRPVAVLAAFPLTMLALYGLGVLLPYFVTGLHRLPLAEVASGAHDPKGLWPQNGWAGPVALAGLFSVTLGPFVVLAAAGVGGVWLTSMWRRPGPRPVLRSLAVLGVVAGSVTAMLFFFSEPGAALTSWRLD